MEIALLGPLAGWILVAISRAIDNRKARRLHERRCDALRAHIERFEGLDR